MSIMWTHNVAQFESLIISLQVVQINKSKHLEGCVFGIEFTQLEDRSIPKSLIINLTQCKKIK